MPLEALAEQVGRIVSRKR